MDKQLVAVLGKFPEQGLHLISEHFEVRYNSQDKILAASELKKFVKGASAIISHVNDKIDDQVLAASGKQLKIIANFASGYDNIDLDACRKRRITVTNTPGVSSNAVAEHIFGLILAVQRHLVEADKYVRSGKFRGWQSELFMGSELFGKTLGILGLGRIGRRVAEIGAFGFKMKVIYYDRAKPEREFNQRTGAEAVSIRKVLTASDYLSLHVPLTSKTRHLISRSELSAMKKTAILINTSRGPVVDEKELAQALKRGTIAGAGIDVFEFEPAVIPELKALQNVVFTPHIASSTHEARSAMAVLAVKNILAVLEGKAPLTPVQ